MKDYKGITPQQRLESLKLTNKAIKEGIIPKPTKCRLCGRTTGRIDYHNETYQSPTKELFQICQGCHMRWHNRDRYPEIFCKCMSNREEIRENQSRDEGFA